MSGGEKKSAHVFADASRAYIMYIESIFQPASCSGGLLMSYTRFGSNALYPSELRLSVCKRILHMI